MRTYQLTVPATRDLLEISDWYEENAALGSGDRLLQAIADQCELLAKQPGIGAARPEFGAEVRTFNVHPYRLFY